MTTGLTLLAGDGTTSQLRLREPPRRRRPTTPLTSRIAYAAAHVVPHAWGDTTPGGVAEIDWDATLAVRRELWSWGLGVADAMDTAQRGMGLDPAATSELISRSAAEAEQCGGRLVVGVGTDHLTDDLVSLDGVVAAYHRQLAAAEDVGAGVVLMASRHLARAAQGPADYASVYRRVLERAARPVLLHWLGAAFDPALAGYFGSAHVPTAMTTVAEIIAEAGDRVAGIKLSLLDEEAERGLRRRLPEGVRMFTGDDFHYVDLIAGDGTHHSDALLGAFSAIAPAASAALQALDAGDAEGYERELRPTEALSRQLFAAPTYYYKTGIAFLSWVNGHQRTPAMVGGLLAARSLPHLSEILRLADAAGVLDDPELAAARWHTLLSVHGLGDLAHRPASARHAVAR